jgi:hypothetical protein
MPKPPDDIDLINDAIRTARDLSVSILGEFLSQAPNPMGETEKSGPAISAAELKRLMRRE